MCEWWRLSHCKINAYPGFISIPLIKNALIPPFAVLTGIALSGDDVKVKEGFGKTILIVNVC